jgi:hypothetical protein
MVKTKKAVKKIFKVKKKVINDDKNNFVVRFKGLSRTEEKDLRSDLDVFLGSYFEYSKESEDKPDH